MRHFMKIYEIVNFYRNQLTMKRSLYCRLAIFVVAFPFYIQGSDEYKIQVNYNDRAYTLTNQSKLVNKSGILVTLEDLLNQSLLRHPLPHFLTLHLYRIIKNNQLFIFEDGIKQKIKGPHEYLGSLSYPIPMWQKALGIDYSSNITAHHLRSIDSCVLKFMREAQPGPQSVSAFPIPYIPRSNSAVRTLPDGKLYRFYYSPYGYAVAVPVKSPSEEAIISQSPPVPHSSSIPLIAQSAAVFPEFPPGLSTSVESEGEQVPQTSILAAVEQPPAPAAQPVLPVPEFSSPTDTPQLPAPENPATTPSDREHHEETARSLTAKELERQKAEENVKKMEKERQQKEAELAIKQAAQVAAKEAEKATKAALAEKAKQEKLEKARHKAAALQEEEAFNKEWNVAERESDLATLIALAQKYSGKQDQSFVNKIIRFVDLLNKLETQADDKPEKKIEELFPAFHHWLQTFFNTHEHSLKKDSRPALTHCLDLIRPKTDADRQWSRAIRAGNIDTLIALAQAHYGEDNQECIQRTIELVELINKQGTERYDLVTFHEWLRVFYTRNSDSLNKSVLLEFVFCLGLTAPTAQNKVDYIIAAADGGREQNTQAICMKIIKRAITATDEKGHRCPLGWCNHVTAYVYSTNALLDEHKIHRDRMLACQNIKLMTLPTNREEAIALIRYWETALADPTTTPAGLIELAKAVDPLCLAPAITVVSQEKNAELKRQLTNSPSSPFLLSNFLPALAEATRNLDTERINNKFLIDVTTVHFNVLANSISQDSSQDPNLFKTFIDHAQEVKGACKIPFNNELQYRSAVTSLDRAFMNTFRDNRLPLELRRIIIGHGLQEAHPIVSLDILLHRPAEWYEREKHMSLVRLGLDSLHSAIALGTLSPFLQGKARDLIGNFEDATPRAAAAQG